MQCGVIFNCTGTSFAFLRLKPCNSTLVLDLWVASSAHRSQLEFTISHVSIAPSVDGCEYSFSLT